VPIRRCAPGSSSVAQPNGLEENTIGFWTVLCFKRRFLDDSIGLACIVLTALVLAFSLGDMRGEKTTRDEKGDASARLRIFEMTVAITIRDRSS